MVFWIVLGLVIVIAVITGIYHGLDYDDIGHGLFNGFMALLFGVLIGGLLLSLMAAVLGRTGTEIENKDEKSTTYKLKTIGGGETYEGKYYLAGQLVEGDRHYVYMYVKPGKEEGYDTLTLGDVPIDQATVNIVETDEPYVKYSPSIKVQNDWLFPWRITSTKSNKEVQFFVPADAVLTDYSLLATDEEAKDW